MSDDRAVVEVLNELLQAESAGLGQRLGESQPFAHLASVERLAAVQSCAAESREHVAWLSELIVSLRGVPAPHSPDAYTTDLHYLQVDALLPRVIADCEKLIAAYNAAAARLADSPPATDLLTRIRTRHEKQLKILKDLCPTATRA